MVADVKICGIMTTEHARAAVHAGARYIGLVFAPSRRQVSPGKARVLADAAREAARQRDTSVEVVGVFVNEQPAIINGIVAEVGLDWVQLSGHEDTGVVPMLSRPVIKAVRFDEHPSETTWLALSDTSNVEVAALLVDAHVHGSYGGAGVTADWQRAAQLAASRRVWLAGGLRPENVAEAVAHVQPHVVDVSSGVETNGVKDIAKIEAFIRAATSRVATPPTR